MPNLFTITGNLLAETTAKFAFPKCGQTVRALSEESFQTGGKGVNAAKAFCKLSKKKPFAVVFPAGFNGKRCLAQLAREGFCRVLAFEIPGETRGGLVCEDFKTGRQTTFLGADTPIDGRAFLAALAKIESLSKRGDFLAFCGSFAGWKRAYAGALARLCRRKALRLCVDTYGAPLDDLLKEEIFLLKINKAEFLAAFKEKSLSRASFEKCAQKIRAENFAITNSSGAAFARFGGIFTAAKPPKITREVSATGCGDAMFASLIFELSRGTDARRALKISLARASASAETAATSQWSEARAKKLLAQIS